MPLKYELDSIDGLDESVKSLYTEKDGKYVLGIEGLPQPEDVSGLKSKVDELLAEKKTESEKRKKAEEEARIAAEEAAKRNGDYEALAKSYEERMELEREQLRGETEQERKERQQLEMLVTNLTSGQTATRMAAEISVQGSADVLLPHIERRLKTEYREGKAVTVVLDKDGRPSAMTVDDLKKEFTENPAFAPLIVGSRASGAGRHSDHGGGAAKTWSQLTGMERVELRRNNPAEHARLKAQHEAANNR